MIELFTRKLYKRKTVSRRENSSILEPGWEPRTQMNTDADRFKELNKGHVFTYSGLHVVLLVHRKIKMSIQLNSTHFSIQNASMLGDLI